MTFVKESLESVLKPKSLKGKKFYVESTATGHVEFILEIVKEEGGYYTFAVTYNSFMIEGPDVFSMIKGDSAILNLDEMKELLEYYGFQELDKEPIKKLDKEIEELENFKNYLQSLL